MVSATAVPDRLLDANEVAAILFVQVSWVREHTRLGDIPHVRLGRYVRYRYEAVIEWVRSQEQDAGTTHTGSQIGRVVGI